MSSFGPGPLSASDNQAEIELHASASAAASSPAVYPRGRTLQRQAQLTRVGESDDNDLDSKLHAIVREYTPGNRNNSPASSTPSPKTATSSMALSVQSRSTLPSAATSLIYSNNTTPALSYTSSTLKSSSSSAWTGRADSVIERFNRLEQGEDDIAQRLAEDVGAQLGCFFSFIGCANTFSDLETWDRHCRAHYRGMLPPVAACPFPRCSWSRRAQSTEAWLQRLSHMMDEHADEDFEFRGKPDKAITEHLYRTGSIDVIQYQELRSEGRLSERAVLNTSSRREDRRHRGH